MGKKKTILPTIYLIPGYCSVAKSCLTLFEPMNCSMSDFPVLRVCSNSRPLSRWCHPTISFSVTPFSSCPQFFPASGSFPMSWLLTPGGQSIEASASVFPMENSGLISFRTGLISLQSKGLSRVVSSVTVQKHQFFDVQPFLWSNSHIHTRLLEKP